MSEPKIQWLSGLPYGLNMPNGGTDPGYYDFRCPECKQQGLYPRSVHHLEHCKYSDTPVDTSYVELAQR